MLYGDRRRAWRLWNTVGGPWSKTWRGVSALRTLPFERIRKSSVAIDCCFVSFRQACTIRNGGLDSETVALRDPVMPVSDGFGGQLVRIKRGQLRERNCQVPALSANQHEHVAGIRIFGRKNQGSHALAHAPSCHRSPSTATKVLANRLSMGPLPQ